MKSDRKKALMTNGLRFKRAGVVAAVVAVAAAPAVAFAATPRKRGVYAGGGINLAVSKTGKSLKLTSVGYCHNWSWKIATIGIKNGKFSFSGSTTNHVHASVHGSFVTTKKATGTVQIGSCSKSSFTAKYTGGY